MESSYGIGVTNRYDLFCMDDDANDPGDSVLNRKAKQKKAAAKAAAAAAAAGGPEKENKAIITPAPLGKEKDHTPKAATTKTNAAAAGAGQQPAKARAIKETQNIRNNSERAPREG